MPILTAAGVQKYTATAKRREIPDSKAPGLYLIIQPRSSGAKSWALRFRRPDGRPAKMWIGAVDISIRETKDEPVIGGPLTLRQARVLATEIDRQRARGLDVIEELKAERARKRGERANLAANTFGSCAREFFASYKTKRQTRPRRWRDDASLLGLRYPPGCDPATAEPVVIRGSLSDVWADKPVADIDGHDVHAVVSEAGSEGRARKLYAALSTLFSWLLRERRVAANPCRGVWRPGPPPARDRILNDAEIVAFWRACDAFGPPFGPLFQILLLTGCRLREAAGMKRSELADGHWTIPAARSKNHREHTVPMPTLAIQIIGKLPVVEGGLVFTTRGDVPVSGFSVAKRQLDAQVAKTAGHPVPFRLHDLRRTFVSGLASLGVALPVIERCVNHVSGSFGGVAGVYQRYDFAKEKREALERWAGHVERLVAGESGKVVDLHGRCDDHL